jgi:hypothetical protein
MLKVLINQRFVNYVYLASCNKHKQYWFCGYLVTLWYSDM